CGDHGNTPLLEQVCVHFVKLKQRMPQKQGSWPKDAKRRFQRTSIEPPPRLNAHQKHYKTVRRFSFSFFFGSPD
ncbi:MAG: hypothetical protein AAB925_00975, partial [Patescibacteria group bacterium]